MTNPTPLIARILLASVFLKSGIDKVFGFAGTQAYMAQYMPGLNPILIQILLVITIITLLIGGGSLLAGYKIRWGAVLLILFLIPATLIFHTDFSERMQQIQFFKNLAIMGGLLMVVSSGAGPLSVDSYLYAKKSRYFSRYSSSHFRHF